MVPTAVMIAIPAIAWAPPGEIDFNRDVRPILAANCFACHGFDEHARKAGLRLDVAESAYASSDGVTPIVPGDPDASELWRRIASPDPDEVMPPPESHRELDARERNLIRQWIEEGAPYARHWAFVPPRKVDVDPDVPSPIDRLVRVRLADEGLAPAPPADRATLLRRVALDLVGLPPTADEIAAFVADPDPDAYE
ncbi:MAG: c-type cytochrome domain-containing protein, partial [Phycisphaerales bacterium]